MTAPLAAGPTLPQVGTTRESARGVDILSSLVHDEPSNGGLGWTFRRQPESDFGIDGHIEVVGTPRDPKGATGRFISVQVKAGASYFAHDDGEAWSVYVRRSTATYWSASSLPVLLILVDLETEACYWVQADTVWPESHGATVRIRVPRANRLSAESREELRSLAYYGLPPLFELVDTADIAAIRQEILSRERTAATPEQWLAIADSWMAFADDLARRHRRRQSAIETARSVRALFRAGASDRARLQAARALRIATDDLRDAELAQLIEQAAELPPTGAAPSLGTESGFDASQWTLALARAEARALEGISASVTQVVAALRDRIANGALDGAGAERQTEVDRLAAVAAVLCEDHAAAAALFTKAAASAKQESLRAELAIRSHLHQGLDGDTAPALDRLLELKVPPAQQPMRQSAIGWLRALAGDAIGGAEAFRAGADAAGALGEPDAVECALRNTSWAERRGGVWRRDRERPAVTARRVRLGLASRTPERETGRRLLEDAARSLRADELQPAYRHALSARAISSPLGTPFCSRLWSIG